MPVFRQVLVVIAHVIPPGIWLLLSLIALMVTGIAIAIKHGPLSD